MTSVRLPARRPGVCSTSGDVGGMREPRGGMAGTGYHSTHKQQDEDRRRTRRRRGQMRKERMRGVSMGADAAGARAGAGPVPRRGQMQRRPSGWRPRRELGRTIIIIKETQRDRGDGFNSSFFLSFFLFFFLSFFPSFPSFLLSFFHFIFLLKRTRKYMIMTRIICSTPSA